MKSICRRNEQTFGFFKPLSCACMIFYRQWLLTSENRFSSTVALLSRNHGVKPRFGNLFSALFINCKLSNRTRWFCSHRNHQTFNGNSNNSRGSLLRVSEDDKNLSSFDGEKLQTPLAYVCVSVQGTRPTMEDRYCAVSPSICDGNISLFGVFDGHAGPNCAEYLSHALPSVILRNLAEFKATPEKAIDQTFLKLDEHFCSFAASRNLRDGSSALVSIVERNPESGLATRSVFACAGDSRAVVVRRSGRVKQMNRELTPYLEDEAQRVRNEGGFVQMVGDEFEPYENGTLRVNGLLAMTRAFGNVSLKPFVTAKPEITIRKLRKDDMFIVLASDGLWETVENEEVGVYLLKYGLQTGVKKIVELALNRGSTDNITVQAVVLNMLNDHVPV